MNSVETPSNNIRVDKSNVCDGRGVFADVPFVQGQAIEVCEVLIVSEAEKNLVDKTSLYNYYFDWQDGDLAIALGYGSLYNHSYKPNACYIKNKLDGSITFEALSAIEIGEEIPVNYNEDPKDDSPLWFQVSTITTTE